MYICWYQTIFIVPFTHFIHVFTWPLQWQWYDDVMVCLMFILLQKAMNVSAMKFVPASDTVFFGSPYYVKMSLAVCTGDLLISCLLSSVSGICCGNYNTQKSFTINQENVCTNHFPWPAWYFIKWCFFLGLHSQVPQACG